MNIMCIIELETPNFSFIAFGDNVDEAEETLQQALKKHAHQYNLPENWADDYDRSGYMATNGEAFRNREQIL